MGFSYDKLWKMLIDKNLNKTTLRDKSGISNSTLSRLSKNSNVSMSALEKICITLNCDISDIVEYKNEGVTVYEKKV